MASAERHAATGVEHRAQPDPGQGSGTRHLPHDGGETPPSQPPRRQRSVRRRFAPAQSSEFTSAQSVALTPRSDPDGHSAPCFRAGSDAHSCARTNRVILWALVRGQGFDLHFWVFASSREMAFDAWVASNGVYLRNSPSRGLIRFVKVARLFPSLVQNGCRQRRPGKRL